MSTSNAKLAGFSVAELGSERPCIFIHTSENTGTRGPSTCRRGQPVTTQSRYQTYYSTEFRRTRQLHLV